MNHKLIITGLQAELAKARQELADLQAKYNRDVNGAKKADKPKPAVKAAKK